MYDEEIQAIEKLTQKLIYKYSKVSPTFENLREFEKEARGRFLDIGFHAEVNMVDYLLDVLDPNHQGPPTPPEFVIVARVDPIAEFDHEKKGYEVKKNSVN